MRDSNIASRWRTFSDALFHPDIVKKLKKMRGFNLKKFLRRKFTGLGDAFCDASALVQYYLEYVLRPDIGDGHLPAGLEFSVLFSQAVKLVANGTANFKPKTDTPHLLEAFHSFCALEPERDGKRRSPVDVKYDIEGCGQIIDAETQQWTRVNVFNYCKTGLDVHVRQFITFALPADAADTVAACFKLLLPNFGKSAVCPAFFQLLES
jgi:hypothetical protein